MSFVTYPTDKRHGTFMRYMLISTSFSLSITKVVGILQEDKKIK